ncbi:hypothetical protein S40288_11553 [Stachybotrys chartarum IBT 40288]|nr:hypothetical protein S40288_11553 [Stachybotrys chartarum IBT 40288]
MPRTKPSPVDHGPLAAGRPLSPTLVDYEIRAFGGTTTAFDTMPQELQKEKTPVSMKNRIRELTVENGRLRREIEYYKTLVNEVLHPVMALSQFHVHGLLSSVGNFNAKIEQLNAQWQAEQAVYGDSNPRQKRQFLSYLLYWTLDLTLGTSDVFI